MFFVSVELERFGINVLILETGLVKTNTGSIELKALETSAHAPYGEIILINTISELHHSYQVVFILKFSTIGFLVKTCYR